MTARCFPAALSGLVVLSAWASAQPAATDALSPEAAAMKAHISFLADDLLQGREAGTPGYDIAARYVAAQFALAGLEPGGDDGSYFQPVRLRKYSRNNAGASFIVRHDNGAAEPLQLSRQFYVNPDPARERAELTAPVVFAGFGVVAPHLGQDDYADLDVEGNIVAVLAGAPKSFPAGDSAHFGARAHKQRAAADRGAIGLITIFTPTQEARYPFRRAARGSGSRRMTWLGSDGKAKVPAPEIKVAAYLSKAAGAALFTGSPLDYDAVIAAGERTDTAVPTGPLAVRVSLAQRSTFEDVDSMNVIGILPGADPVRANETVVLTAHLDHIGVSGDLTAKDRINNGALDNSAGVAATIEAAKAAIAGPDLPRTTAFVALTAEEKGLIGAEYFVTNTPQSVGEIVANVNLDMPLLLYDFTDVTAFGAERSTLGPLVQAAATRVGVTLSPDPMPQENLLVRSDHYEFVQGGIPSVFLVTGFANGGEEAFGAFLSERYHRPSDDLTAPIDYEAGAKFARMNYEILWEVSNAAERPKWRAGDVYGVRYGGPMEQSASAVKGAESGEAPAQ